MPYLCWMYNDDIQQGFTGINTCAVDMLNALLHYKGDILLIAHNSDYDCIFLQIKATYYNTIRKKKQKY